MKSSYLSTLIQLLLLGAKNPIELSTYDLAKSIDKTQQTASQHLLFLEKNNLIFRYKIDGNDVLKISDSGLDYLKSVNQQITSYVYDVVRAEVPKKTLDEVFESKDVIAQTIKAELTESMDDFGYQIIKSLITDIDPDPNVKDAMNQINATARLRVAAQNEAEADKIRQVKNAEADAEAKKLQGQGVAQQRAAIIDGFKESISDLKEVTGAEVKTQDVMNMVMMVQYFDALRDIGTTGQNNAVLIPYGAGGSNEIMKQMTEAMIVADQIQTKSEPDSDPEKNIEESEN